MAWNTDFGAWSDNEKEIVRRAIERGKTIEDAHAELHRCGHRRTLFALRAFIRREKITGGALASRVVWTADQEASIRLAVLEKKTASQAWDAWPERWRKQRTRSAFASFFYRLKSRIDTQ